MAVRDNGKIAVGQFNALVVTEGVTAATAWAAKQGLAPADDEVARAQDFAAAAVYEAAKQTNPFQAARVSALYPGLHQHTTPRVQRGLDAVTERAIGPRGGR